MARSAALGFTLVECLVACVVAVLLAAIAASAWRGQSLRAARQDAVAALMQLQTVQERYRSLHGLYAADLSVLHGVAPVSEQGRYALALERTGAQAYRATAVAQGAQAADSDCRALTLEVNLGFATPGPGPQCWNR